jgi:spermidine synthase
MAKKQKQDWIPRRENDEPEAKGAAAPVVVGRKAERLEATALYALVLLCGIGLMSLEMVGARVLWNNFGSSVFVWGSIISVFMAALALGYYSGGLLADWKPSLSWLAGIVGLAGMSVLLLTQLSGRICNWVDGMDLGARGGPLVASVVLYFLPSVLLGMISPFAVRLQAKTLASMGNVAGRLYALGTVGSLGGTLLTTFVLIPLMGTTKIIYSIGVILLAAAVLGLAACFASRGGPRTRAGVAATLIFLCGTFLMGYVLSPMNLPFSLTPPVGIGLKRDDTIWQHLITFQESAYHNVAVIGQFNPAKYGREEGKPGKVKISLGMKQDPDAVLEMRFNNLTESSLYPNRPGKTPQTTYTRILHMAMAINPKASKVLVVGLGGGSVPREFCEVYADRNMQVDVVEVDPLVARIASEYFFHRDKGGVRTFVTDGRQFVRRADRPQPRYFMGANEKMTWKQDQPLGKYDMIILDAYSGGGQIPAHLVTLEFLEQCRARLAPDGVLVSNIISALEGPKSRFFRAEYKTMKKLFKHIYVFPSWRGNQPRNIRNLILIATRTGKQELLKEDLVARAKALIKAYPALEKRTTNPNIRGGTLASFAEGCYLPSQGDLKNVPELTDDYAPVETMFYWSTRFGR